MMEDSNVIAHLYPADDERKSKPAWDSIRMQQNSNRYIPPQEAADRGSRESTVSSDDEGCYAPKYTSYPGLQLTFDSELKTGEGIVIGIDDQSDIVLQGQPGTRISRRHCSLTFDAQRRLVLQDFSHNGTIVTYDGRGAEKRKHFPWILSGRNLSEVKKIIIEIGEIKFQIVVPEHNDHPALYIDNVDRFLLRANANGDLPFGALGIQSTSSTAPQSGALTPHAPIYIKQWRLGSGLSSTVDRVWDVSTGLVFACKKISAKFDYRKEASITERVSRLSNVGGSLLCCCWGPS
jgi:hypothetical protein